MRFWQWAIISLTATLGGWSPPAIPSEDAGIEAIANVFIRSYAPLSRLDTFTASSSAKPLDGARVTGVASCYAHSCPEKKFDWLIEHVENTPCTYRLRPYHGELPGNPISTIAFDHLTQDFQVRPMRIVVKGFYPDTVCDFIFGHQECHQDLVTVPIPDSDERSLVRSLRYIFSRVCEPALPPS